MSKNYNFIKATNEYCTLNNHVPAPLLRKTFTVKKEVKKATFTITALGFYELHFNGRDITKGILAPYRSNPNDYIYFDSYDVTSLVAQGKNVIAAILGNGMQNALGAYIWSFDQASWRSAPICAFNLDIEYTDAKTERIFSDLNTKTAPSPILFDDLHYGEYYDASLEIKDWDKADFDDSAWKNVIEAKYPIGAFRICEAEPIINIKKLNPISVTECDGGYIYDFGVNFAGLCELKIKNSKKGQKILLQHFEMLKNGKPFFDNFRFNRDGVTDLYQEDIYYCAGRPLETHLPRFTYHGFRYVYVTGITKEQATDELLTYNIYSSNLQTRGSFSCSDDIINSLQECTVRSDISNFYYFPTDCPQREKNGWTADAALSASQMLFNLSPENSYAEWLRNIYKAMSDRGELPGIIPTAGWGFGWGNGPAWDKVIVELPYYTYIFRGDKSILTELSEPLFKYLNYLEGRMDENGLLSIGLGDWCQVDEKPTGPDAPLIVTDSITTVDITRKAEFIYGVLGDTEKQNRASQFKNRLLSAIREHLIDKDTLVVKGNTQTCQAMALYYDIFNEDEKQKALAHLIKQINEKNNHFHVGVLGGNVIFRVLADNGYSDLAFDMIKGPDYPSFGYFIEKGATTLFEDFNFVDGYPVNSLNHHFWGDISAWFYIYLAGFRLNPNRNDANEVNISPCFVEKLEFVNAEHIIPCGTVSVKWERMDNRINLSVSIPDDAHGKIILPQGYIFEDSRTEIPLNSGMFEIKKA